MSQTRTSSPGSRALAVLGLDLTRALAGPWCTADSRRFGKPRIIKVERPERGDASRGLGSAVAEDAAAADTSESSYFCPANRNKKLGSPW